MTSHLTPGDELLFLALGGSAEIGMNINLYGCQGKWLMVDLGMTFGPNEYPGTELVFADLDFIEDRLDDLLGIVLTHGHEDHIGAIPYFAADLGVPLYATGFTAGLIRHKLNEAGISSVVELNVVPAEGELQLGPFNIRYLPIPHSIAEGNALVIDTPHGRVVHTGDWKLDDRPLVGPPTPAEEFAEIGDAGVLALVCDSTNAFNPAASGSEGDVLDGLIEVVLKQTGRRVLVTTFASNVARLHALGEVARVTGRKLCVAGRSLDRIIEVGQASGYLKELPPTVSFDEAMRLPRGEVLIVSTGGQGEPRAALARITGGTHQIKLEAGDVVLFSSRQIPGNEVAIGRIQNSLAEQQIKIITEKQAHVHVSGHPGQPELRALYEWVRPEILLPVHGEMRHMREQARVGAEAGIPKQIVQKNGDVIRLAPGKPGLVERVHTGRLLLDGDLIIPANGETITARRRLAANGLLMVALPVDEQLRLTGDPVVESIGLPLDEEQDDFLAEAAADVSKALATLKGEKRRDRDQVMEAARLAARRAAGRWCGKKPVTHVLLVGE